MTDTVTITRDHDEIVTDCGGVFYAEFALEVEVTGTYATVVDVTIKHFASDEVDSAELPQCERVQMARCISAAVISGHYFDYDAVLFEALQLAAMQADSREETFRVEMAR